MLRPSIAYVHGCHADRGVLCVVGVVSSVVATVDGFAHSCAVRDVADCAVHPQVCARMARVLKARRCARRPLLWRCVLSRFGGSIGDSLLHLFQQRLFAECDEVTSAEPCRSCALCRQVARSCASRTPSSARGTASVEIWRPSPSAALVRTTAVLQSSRVGAGAGGVLGVWASKHVSCVAKFAARHATAWHATACACACACCF